MRTVGMKPEDAKPKTARKPAAKQTARKPAAKQTARKPAAKKPAAKEPQEAAGEGAEA